VVRKTGLFKRKKEEKRTLPGEVDASDLLLSALLGTATISKQQALNIPSLNGCIEYIGNTVAMLPIKLYQEIDGKVEEIKDDKRLRILNDDTGDTLDAAQFWKAFVADYFLGKGGYAYVKKERNNFISLHYVDEIQVSVNKNVDPIFKDYDILVNAQTYKPYDFLKILRKTKDGCQGISIVSETPIMMSVGYNTLVFENALVTKGGNKKGFLKSSKKLSQEVIDVLKTAWRNLYSNNEENVVILNDGLEFQEASNTSVEMQLNENKESNSSEICKLLNVPESIIKGTATDKDYINGFKLAVMPILRIIECALNKDMLLESEKSTKYWLFDTREITKGDIETRYKSYTEAVKAGWISKNEIRYIEDYPEIEGLDVVTMSLGEVIYDINSKTYFTPNTKMIQDVSKGGAPLED
jgi:HK97 family phage portal protein